MQYYVNFNYSMPIVEDNNMQYMLLLNSIYKN